MGEPKIWRIKYTWARRVDGGFETAFGEILVENTDLDRAVGAARQYFHGYNLEAAIQSVENLGPLVVRL